jgi:hypothetical protein
MWFEMGVEMGVDNLPGRRWPMMWLRRAGEAVAYQQPKQNSPGAPYRLHLQAPCALGFLAIRLISFVERGF